MPKRNREEEQSQESERSTGSTTRQKLSHDYDAEGEEIRGPVSSQCTRRFSYDDYTIGWICALSIEMAAAQVMLDEIHPGLERLPNDNNAYILGRIGAHNIVIACLPSGRYGTTSATMVANQMKSTFQSIYVWLMVGIAGGVPGGKTDIRLGDIVVGEAVIQHDYGKVIRNGRIHCTDSFSKPPQLLLTAVAKLRANHGIWGSKIPELLSEVVNKHPKIVDKLTYHGQQRDILYRADYGHIEGEDSCGGCDPENIVFREPRRDDHPMIHYGKIASGNQVIRNGILRDRLGEELDILCFEMEAAGLVQQFQPLNIRGICDYADSHKNKEWQEYSAATAAAYAKELLLVLPLTQTIRVPVTETIPAEDTLQKRQSLIESLEFEQINARQATIKNAHTKTCKWLLKKSEYQDWLNVELLPEHHGFLWIKGKPGTGKSTIMKFALKNAEKTLTESLIISFFFNARGEDLEKSVMGMYRSLLCQLLKKEPELACALDSIRLPSTSTSKVQNSWTLEVLQDSFIQALEKLGNQRLICFIDALDECDEDQIRDMVAFFETTLGQYAVSTRIRLHVCFSSRHYPHITIDKGRHLVLEGQEDHDRDIANYLSSELKIGNGKQVAPIRAEILEKASGIFLWVILVVQILKKEYDRGRMHALRKRLQEIPLELNALFKDILMRDNQNIGELLLCIQWILYSRRPLSPPELYFAILSAEGSDSLTGWDPEETTDSDIGRFILNSSKGLAELTKSKKQTVQFIHESVRDFLLKDNGLANLWSEFGGIFFNGHDRLKQCCYNYMKIDISKYIPLPATLPRAMTTEAQDLRQSVSAKFPFLEYAVHNVLYHANLAEESGSPQDDFIKYFPLRDWNYRNNLIEKFEIRRHTPDVSLLYILAEQGLSSLIKFRLEPTLCDSSERYLSAIFAAFLAGNQSTVEEILLPDVSLRSQIDISSDLDHKCREDVEALLKSKSYPRSLDISSFLTVAAQEHKWSLVRFLLSMGQFDVNKPGSEGKVPIIWAAGDGEGNIVRLLLANDAVVEFRAENGRTPLSYAAEKGHAATAKLLIDNGADLEARDRYGQAPLFFAVMQMKGQTAKLLIDNGADMEARDKDGRTPLIYAISYGYGPIANLLIDNGADLEASDESCRTSLHLAVINGHDAIAKLLIDNGADLGARDKDGRTPLSYAISYGYGPIANLLIDNGADPEVSDKKGRNCLIHAAMRGHIALVELFLKNGSSLECKAHDERTPLSWAAGEGFADISKLLLEHGADCESASKSLRTPLAYAVERGREDIVRLPIENGAEVETKCNENRTALSYAADCWRGSASAALLLDNGAEIESRCSNGRTPLSYAVSKSEDTVRLLLGRGADIESKCGKGRTPLTYAAQGVKDKIAQILIKHGAKVDIMCHEGRTPLSYAAKGRHIPLLRLLLRRGVRVDLEDNLGRTPLSYAAQASEDTSVQLLVEKGARVDLEDNLGRTPLSYAAQASENTSVQLLVEKGARVDLEDKLGRTPLSYAACEWDSDVVVFLLKHKANIDSKCKSNRTPLSYAMEKGEFRVIEALLEGGADLGAKDIENRSPLWYARNREKIMSELVKMGYVDPDNHDV